jgi:hypothetical protein
MRLRDSGRKHFDLHAIATGGDIKSKTMTLHSTMLG